MSFFTTKEKYPQEVLEQEFVFTNNAMRLSTMLDVCQAKCFQNEPVSYLKNKKREHIPTTQHEFGLDGGPDSTKSSLTKGETLCVDRCISKFYAVAKMLDEKSQKSLEEQSQ